jgi:glycosyltransferase involved in cell wall biosynthesis
MKPSPLVTIGIPAYRGQFLSQCIASALTQTFSDFEILISDDSVDGSVARVVSAFGDERIRLIEGPRAGLIENSIHIWENARGAFLKYLYDDDFLMPFSVASLLAALTEHEDAPFAFARRHIVDAAGAITQSPTMFSAERQVVIMPKTALHQIISKKTNPFGEPTNILIRLAAFDGPSCLKFYCGVPIRHMLDVAFYLDACPRGPSIGVPAYLAVFRKHQDQVTSDLKAPAFSAGIFEWELFIRGAVHSAQVEPSVGLEPLTLLGGIYAHYARDFPELETFAAGLPDLRRRLENNETEVLDAGFLQVFAAANTIIDQRLAQSRLVRSA